MASKDNPKFKGVILDKDNNPEAGTEFIGWHSRSCAVVVIITNKNHDFFLIEKRGKGCPDFVGKLCLPCGYLNWDETLVEAAQREVYEETGMFLSQDDLKFFKINDNPKNNRQNVSIYYIAEVEDSYIMDRINEGIINTNTALRHGEPDEVEQIMWASKQYVRKHADEFCFHHNEILLNDVILLNTPN